MVHGKKVIEIFLTKKNVCNTLAFSVLAKYFICWPIILSNVLLYASCGTIDADFSVNL